jgi:organic radical activating enzyme
MIHSKHSSSSFCVLPFIQQFVNTDNRIAPCCISDYSHGGPEYKDANSFNCDYLKNIRREMLYSKQPKPCSICYKDEAKGKSSKRIEVNKQFEDWEYITNGQGYMYTMPQYYDLRPGNVCNLKCIMCNPQNSSKWIEDNHLLEDSYDKVIKFSDETINDILSNSKSIKRIQLAGGEPFYMKSVKRLLTGLVESGDSKHINLQITTNLTIVTETILQLLEHFKKIVITISVDGIGKVGEYIRFPLNWETFEKNVDKLLLQKEKYERKDWYFAVNVTKSQLNAEHIDTIIDWCKSKNINDVDVFDLEHPSVLAVGNPRSELITWLTAFDNHRGTDSKSVLPWIYK